MIKKICCYCEEEKKRDQLIYSKSFQDYICHHCRVILSDKDSKSEKEESDACV